MAGPAHTKDKHEAIVRRALALAEEMEARKAVPDGPERTVNLVTVGARNLVKVRVP